MAEVDCVNVLQDVEFDDGELGELAVRFVVGFGLWGGGMGRLLAKRLHLFLL